MLCSGNAMESMALLVCKPQRVLHSKALWTMPCCCGTCYGPSEGPFRYGSRFQLWILPVTTMQSYYYYVLLALVELAVSGACISKYQQPLELLCGETYKPSASRNLPLMKFELHRGCCEQKHAASGMHARTGFRNPGNWVWQP